MFERAAQRDFGVSGDVFLERLRANYYGDPDEYPNDDLHQILGLVPRESRPQAR